MEKSFLKRNLGIIRISMSTTCELDRFQRSVTESRVLIKITRDIRIRPEIFGAQENRSESSRFGLVCSSWNEPKLSPG